MQQLMITAVGPDRPGLVEYLTGLLLDAGANVADSRMVNLRGQFAVILLTESPDQTAESLSKVLAGAGGKLGLVIDVAPHSPEAVAHREGVLFRLRTYAMD